MERKTNYNYNWNSEKLDINFRSEPAKRFQALETLAELFVAEWFYSKIGNKCH